MDEEVNMHTTSPTKRAPRSLSKKLAHFGIATMICLGTVGCGKAAAKDSSASSTKTSASSSADNGDTSKSGTDQQASGSREDFMAQMQAYRQCLEDNGVTLPEMSPPTDRPDRSGSTDNSDDPPSPPEGAPDDAAPPTDGNLPTDGTPPADGTGQPGTPGTFGLDTSDPEVAAAVKACESKAPERPDNAQGA